MRVTRNRYGGVSMRGVVPGALLNASLPPLSADWSGPSMTMDAGTWTTELVSPFSFTDPTFNNGSVWAIIDDGAGGKFVGGQWTSVTCNVTSTTYTTGYERLIRLKPNGEVDAAWSCPVGSAGVFAMAYSADLGRLFVGGNFATVGGASKTDLAAVDAATGAVVSAWTCSTNQLVQALLVDDVNGHLYIGCYATSIIGGFLRKQLARASTATGAVDPAWVCDVEATSYTPGVNALALDHDAGVLFVGGNGYTVIGGEARVCLAAVSASTGTVISGWVSNITAFTGRAWVTALVVDKTSGFLYVGAFRGLPSGAPPTGFWNIFRVSLSDGSYDSGWSCGTTLQADTVHALAIDTAAGKLYAAGLFTGVDGSSANVNLASIDVATASVTVGWDCNASGRVRALSLDVANDALFVGGDFNGATGLDGEQRDRFGTVVASTGDLFVP